MVGFCAQSVIVKASCGRALIMSFPHSKYDFKASLRQHGQKIGTSQGTQPVRTSVSNRYCEQISVDIQPMGNACIGHVPKNDSTGRSRERASRELEKNMPPTNRSQSLARQQQPEQRQHNPTNYSSVSSERNTKKSEYGNNIATMASQKYDSAGHGSQFVARSSLTPKFGGTGVSSSVSPGYKYSTRVDTTCSLGVSYTRATTGQTEYQSTIASPGARVDTTTSYIRTPTGQTEYQSLRAPSGSSDAAKIHTYATPSSGPSDASNGGSNGRQSRARDKTSTTRIRSASQGLRNLGNTCYMNSILQCLAKVPWFKDRREQTLKFDDDLLTEFFSLMKKMQENDSDLSLDPHKFRKQISALGIRFSSSEQNDAHEFLLCLLSRLSKSLQSERKADLISDFLSGRQQHLIRFKKCEDVLNNDHPFFSLSLPLPVQSEQWEFRSKGVDLLQCIQHYTRIEDVDGDALCMKCQLMQPCSIEASFKRLPKFLIIHLKRYDFLKAEKLETEISFPLENLKIRQNPSGEVSGCECNVEYDLIAVCNHYGSLRFGHYTADIKSSSNNWYNYSDSRVTQIQISTRSRDAYILFYQQRSV